MNTKNSTRIKPGPKPRSEPVAVVYVEIPVSVRKKMDEEKEISGIKTNKIVENALRRRYDL